MTTIDGLLIKPELVDFLKSYCRDFEGDITLVSISADMMSEIQDYFCIHLGVINEDERIKINEFLESLVETKIFLHKLAGLLPVIKRGGEV